MVFCLEMAKRANPFIEDFVTQSKIHVSLKQFNNNEDRLQKVYEKTLELLFRGAKKSGAQESLNSCETSATKKRDKMKQLFIGKDGSLSHSGNMIEVESSAKKCKCGGPNESQCAYCEVYLCGGCQLSCAHCHKMYCSHCTIIGSEGSQACFSCYG